MLIPVEPKLECDCSNNTEPPRRILTGDRAFKSLFQQSWFDESKVRNLRRMKDCIDCLSLPLNSEEWTAADRAFPGPL
jgi:hypothetical protein